VPHKKYLKGNEKRKAMPSSMSEKDFLASVQGNIAQDDGALDNNKEEHLTDLYTQINAPLASPNDYHTAILLLMQLRDERNNIRWHWINNQEAEEGHRQKEKEKEKEEEAKENNSPHLDILIRDARAQDSDPTESFEGYAILTIQYVRACLALLETELRYQLSDETKQVFNTILTDGLSTLKSAENKNALTKEFRIINANIVTQYQEEYQKYRSARLSKKEAKKRIGIAKDFVALEQPSFHVATLTQVTDSEKNPHTVLEGDIAHCALTATQRTRFENVQNNRNLSNETWFTNLPPWQQALIQKYAPAILAENRVIPTQLRFLPGIRNAWRKVTQIDPQHHPASFSVFHSGTILTYVKENKEDTSSFTEEQRETEESTLTNENIQQLYAQATADVPYNPYNSEPSLHLITLNAKSAFRPVDQNIVNKSAAAVDALNAIEAHGNRNTYSNACVNAAGKVNQKITYPGVQQQLEQVLNFLNLQQENDLQQALIQYLETGAKSKALKTLLEKNVQNLNFKPNDSKEKKCFLKLHAFLLSQRDSFNNNTHFQLFQIAITCKHAIDNHRARAERDSNNHNLQIAAYSHLMSQHLRTLRLSQQINASACQSGKDRNGLVLFASTVYHVWQQFGADVTTKINKFKGQILQQIARSGHTQFMANITGLGCFGIKQDTASAIPQGWTKAAKNLKNLLVLDTASYNKEPKINEKKSKQTKSTRSFRKIPSDSNLIRAPASQGNVRLPAVALKNKKLSRKKSISTWKLILGIIAITVLAGSIGALLGFLPIPGLFALLASQFAPFAYAGLSTGAKIAAECLVTSVAAFTITGLITAGYKFSQWARKQLYREVPAEGTEKPYSYHRHVPTISPSPSTLSSTTLPSSPSRRSSSFFARSAPSFPIFPLNDEDTENDTTSDPFSDSDDDSTSTSDTENDSDFETNPAFRQNS
jgi:hypothetical protein